MSSFEEGAPDFAALDNAEMLQGVIVCLFSFVIVS
jgi:hypothetical protein